MPSQFSFAQTRGPSPLGRLAEGANAAARLRRFMRKTGTTLAGQKLWSGCEIELLLECHPDYRRADALLPDRTLSAIKSKAFRLKITRSRRIWTDEDLSRMRGPYLQGKPILDIEALLPGKTARQIWQRAAYNGWRRPRRPPKAFGFAPYDEIRERAFKLKLTMRDLADLSGTGHYFLRRPSGSDWRKISKAVSLLEGSMSITWPSQRSEACAKS